MNTDERFMRLALEQAVLAAERGEVPVGAVAVRNGEVIATASNCMVGRKSVLGHAEIGLLRKAEELIGDWRMEEVEFFVTKEPCAMCAGALVNARAKRIVFAQRDPRCGACGSSALNVCSFPGMLWQIPCTGGVLEDEAAAIMSDFFRQVRKQKKQSCPVPDGAQHKEE